MSKANKKYTKSAGTYFSLVAGVAALIALICSIITGNQQGDLSYYTIALIAAGAVLDLAVYIIPSKFLFPLLSTAATGAGFMVLLVGRLDKIGLILNNVVEEAIPTLFLVAAGCVLFAMFLNCLTAFVGVRKKVQAAAEPAAAETAEATPEEAKAE
jgi:hypothetical protein